MMYRRLHGYKKILFCNREYFYGAIRGHSDNSRPNRPCRLTPFLSFDPAQWSHPKALPFATGATLRSQMN